MKEFSFEKLIVWQKSRELSKAIYAPTKLFPTDERFGLTSQMRRCAISIASNSVEGTGRHTYKDKPQFTEIAYGSALKLLNQSILCHDLEFISDKIHLAIRSSLTEITEMLNAMHKTQLNS